MSRTDHMLRDRAQVWAGTLVGLIAFASGMAWHAHDLHGMLEVPGDGLGYYQYLPTLLGTHRFTHLPWSHPLHGDHLLSLFTCGLALLQLPWMLFGHLLAWTTGSPMDGYSAPYAVAILLGVSSYTGIATGLLVRTLGLRFPRPVALAAPLLVFAGTNLLYYATRDPLMSHAYVYFLFALLLHLVERNVEAPDPWRTAGILVTCSLAVLIRQLHVIVLLVPLLYRTQGPHALRERLGWLTMRPAITLVGALLALLPWVPQLAYWHLVTGRWLVFAYAYKGERFTHLFDPHLADVLLGVVNGWWVYTPLMALTCLWLAWMAWRREPGGRTLLAITVLVWYGYAAWWCWWLGGSFGHRGFVELQALLAVPLAWGLAQALSWRWWKRVPLVLFLALCVAINIRSTIAYDWDWSSAGWSWERLAVALSGAL